MFRCVYFLSIVKFLWFVIEVIFINCKFFLNSLFVVLCLRLWKWRFLILILLVIFLKVLLIEFLFIGNNLLFEYLICLSSLIDLDDKGIVCDFLFFVLGK